MKWVAGAVLLLAIGLTFQLGLLVYAMYVLLGVIALSRFLARNWIENITSERECSRSVAEIGEKIAVVLRIKNRGNLPVIWLLLEDSLPMSALIQKPKRLQVTGRRIALFSLGGREEKTLLYQITPEMRGYYQIGPLLLESGDLFGLHRRYRVATKPHYVLVYPRVIPLQGYDISSRRPIGEVRMTHRLFEDPTRISGVRPYQTGDSLNRIHWRATARTGILHSKTYEPSTVAGASILLDFHQQNYHAQGEPYRSELAITTAASLANALYLLGQQFGFFTNGRDAADRIRTEGYQVEFATRTLAKETVSQERSSDRLRPLVVETRRGAEQFQQILETLARVELTDGLTFPQLVMEIASRLPRDATIIAILPAVSPETAIALGMLRRNGYAVTGILMMYDDMVDYAESAGMLIAEGIEVRHIENEQSLSDLCNAQLVS